MLDLDIFREPVWPEHLRPIGHETSDPEPFGEWWVRNHPELKHLPPELCEQWIYRSRTGAPFRWLSLGDLSWRLEVMSGEAILAHVHRHHEPELDPEADYQMFARDGGASRHPTAQALDTGTWDYPIVLLATPTGIVSEGEPFPGRNLVLVEGHHRHRYLNALHARSTPPAGPHRVFVIRSPLVNLCD